MTQLKSHLLYETSLSSCCQVPPSALSLVLLNHPIVIYFISQLDWVTDLIVFISPAAYLSCEQLGDFNTGLNQYYKHLLNSHIPSTVLSARE